MSVSPTLRFPDAVDAQTRSVRLRDVTRESLAAAAFLDDRWDRTGCAAHSVPLAELAPDGPRARPVFIWHSAFCCSTLLARCLDKPGRNLSLREPAALMEVANIKRRDGVAVSDLWLRGLVPSLAASAGTDACVTIKPTNTVNNLIADTARLFPQARHLFLTSSLRAFLTSLAKKGEAGRSFARRLFTIFAMDGHAVARSDPRQLMQMSDLQIAAIVWHMQIATMQAALAQGPAAAFASLDGDAFVAAPVAALTAVDRFFGLELGTAHIAATADGPLFTQDAKHAGQAHGAERRRQEAAAIAASLGPELDAIIEWSHGLFPQSPRDGRLPNPLI
jgi:hypothetical protein